MRRILKDGAVPITLSSKQTSFLGIFRSLLMIIATFIVAIGLNVSGIIDNVFEREAAIQDTEKTAVQSIVETNMAVIHTNSEILKTNTDLLRALDATNEENKELRRQVNTLMSQVRELEAANIRLQKELETIKSGQ